VTAARPPGSAAARVDLLGRLPHARLWVIGDVMLDEYLEGEVARISPEAPVPVVRVGGARACLGGAANVAHNARVLGAAVELGGVLGADAAGDTIRELCAARGIGAGALVRTPGRATTRKMRVLARHQQLMRLDWDATEPVAAGATVAILDALAAGPRPDAVVLSDYAKGLLGPTFVAEVLARAAVWGVPVLVDPKAADFARYRGAAVIKPNLAEVARAAGRELDPDDEAGLADAAQALLARSEAGALVVTLGAHGLVVATPGAPLVRLPAAPREVYDVTGAGDTVMAALALAVAAGADVVSAADLANVAGGLAVTHVGTAAITPAELAAAVAPAHPEKVLALPELVARRALWRLQDRRVVVTNGCFDLLHVGHVALLREAARLGDALVVALNSDASVRRLKGGGRPVVPERERAAMIAALECVAAVVLFDEDTPQELLERLRPDVLVKGADYAASQVVGRDFVESYGGRVALVPLVPERSTSALVERIRNGG
jgi:D-beta-D-heptose 7-phosphate kinase/D-beta-D-heptose 1-phosphate adenosyltransferase